VPAPPVDAGIITLDNAIVGFALNHPERFGGKPGQGLDGGQDSS